MKVQYKVVLVYGVLSLLFAALLLLTWSWQPFSLSNRILHLEKRVEQLERNN